VAEVFRFALMSKAVRAENTQGNSRTPLGLRAIGGRSVRMKLPKRARKLMEVADNGQDCNRKLSGGGSNGHLTHPLRRQAIAALTGSRR